MSEFELLANRTVSGAAQVSLSAGGADGLTVVGSGAGSSPYAAVAEGLTALFTRVQVTGQISYEDFFGLWQESEGVLAPGTPLALHTAGQGLTYKQVGALASDGTLSSVFGLSLGAQPNVSPARFISNGLLKLAPAQWDAVIQPQTQVGSPGLAGGSVYYLSDTVAGKIRANVNNEGTEGLPSWLANGSFYVRIGYALDPEVMMINIGNFTQKGG